MMLSAACGLSGAVCRERFVTSTISLNVAEHTADPHGPALMLFLLEYIMIIEYLKTADNRSLETTAG